MSVIQEAIRKVSELQPLTRDEACAVMDEIISGQATQAQIGSLLTALKMKGETVEEITGFAGAMRAKATSIEPRVTGMLMDTCGTGGDGIKTFNISTCAALVMAGAGIPVAKHGNRSFTGPAGSADLLEAFGLNLNTEPTKVRETIEKIGLGFLFAPVFHPAMKNVAGPRREIGIRTVFNILGPLSNPARPKGQIMGVFSEGLLKPLAHSLRNLGCERAMVFHGEGGMDEISTVGRTTVAYLHDSEVEVLSLDPSSFGLKKSSVDGIRSSSLGESVSSAFRILRGTEGEGPRRDAVLANAAAGIFVAGLVMDLKDGVEISRESIESGRAYDKLRMLLRSCGDLSKLEGLEAREGR